MQQTQQQSRKVSFRAGTALFGAVLFGSAVFTAPAWAETYRGKPVKIGHGTAQTIIETDAAGTPTSIAVSVTAGALDGLPAELNKKLPEGSWEYVLPLPKASTHLGYSHVAIDWNPKGHAPSHIYDVPHFDFHFYIMSRAARKKIAFKDASASGDASQQPPAELLPAGYIVPPGTAVSGMGVHAVDPSSPEFHGKPFTTTFIYGYYDKKLTFVEPMVARAFLKTNPDVTMPVKAPAHYSGPGYYPTKYSVRYDAGKHRYLIALDGLTAWKEKTASSPSTR